MEIYPMEITEQDKQNLELVMIRYGMVIKCLNGEKVYNFEHFDLDGFKQLGFDRISAWLEKLIP